MFSVDNTIAMQPVVSPQQGTEPALFGGPSYNIPIRRAFDVRQVKNTDTELVLVFDIPVGASAQDLRVFIEHDKNENPDLYRLRVGGIHWPNAKSFPLNAETVDLHKVEAVLERDTLQVKAPKQNTNGNALFSMAVEALQNLALSVSNMSWDADLVYRDVPIKSN